MTVPGNLGTLQVWGGGGTFVGAVVQMVGLLTAITFGMLVAAAAMLTA